MNNISKLEKFLNFIKELDGSLKFEIIEIGAHPYSQKEEPFYKIFEFFLTHILKFHLDINSL